MRDIEYDMAKEALQKLQQAIKQDKQRRGVHRASSMAEAEAISKSKRHDAVVRSECLTSGASAACTPGQWRQE